MDQETHVARRAGIREPQRQRGIARFQKLLDATEVILTKTPDSDISLAVVAEAAGVPLPSIYHFFPNKDAILVALAQRYHQALSTLAQKPLDPPPGSWQEIIRRRQIGGVAYLNRHPAALRLFMGAGVSAEVRTLDLQGNASLSAIRSAEFRRWFDFSAVPDLEHRVGLSIGIMDGIWAISWSQHRRITEDYLTESIRASTCYLRCFLPEILPAREPIAN
ncbi:TetR/AcrR family transcriptional regulator [Sulfitobacter indolifex]|nr:TetR/AcrR family transcriptional regulator [Sulfitobacter indolifex]